MVNNPLKYTDPTGYLFYHKGAWLDNYKDWVSNPFGSDGGGSFQSPASGGGSRRGDSRLDAYSDFVKSLGTGGLELVITYTDWYQNKGPNGEFVFTNTSVKLTSQSNGVPDMIIGQSFDATLAIGPVGYMVEGGYYTDGTNENFKQFVSSGYTIGAEASVGANLTFIKPKKNFQFSDLEGMGVSFVINIGPVSISVLGNSAYGYPENSVFETYWGIKIGLGVGAGGSYTPNSNTTFKNWMPQVPNNIIIWK